MRLFLHNTRKRYVALVGIIMAMPLAVMAQLRPDAEAVASVAGTPRLNVAFSIEFGFINRGNSNSALNVRVTNTVPAEFTLLSYAPLVGLGAGCTNYGHEVVCTFPSTPPFGSALASVSVVSPVTGTFFNQTAMSRVAGDPNRTNNSLSIPITIQQPAARVRAFTVPETNATLPVAEIWLDSSNSLPVTVQFQTVGDLATPGRNFVPITNTVTFPPGVTSQLVSVTLIDNSFDEPELGFWIALLSATNADLLVGETYAFVTLLDDEPPSSDLVLTLQQTDGGRLGGEFSIGVVVWNAGPEPASNIMLTNRLPPGTTLRFESFFSAPVSGACMETAAGELVCAIGSLPPTWGWTGILFGRTPHTGTQTNFISVGSERRDGNDTNNHGAAAFFVVPPFATAQSAAPGGFSESGSNVLFAATLAMPALEPVSVDYHTLDGAALGGEDFVSTHGTLTFPPGVTNLTVLVPLLEDSLHEAPEQFSLVLSNAFGNDTAVPLGTAIILDNDPPPVLSVEDVTVVEGDSDYAEHGLIFTLSTMSGAPVTVTWSTENGTAVAPGDYYSAKNTVHFPPGVSRIVVPYLQIRGNTTFEPTETFRIVLGPPENATLSRPGATVTILDDDAVPGRLDHFVITPLLPSPRIANRPFPINVRAVDAFEATVTNFVGVVSLRMVDSANVPVGTVNPSLLSSFVNGVWTGAVAAVHGHTNTSLFVDDGAEHTGRSNPFRTVVNPPVRVSVPANAVENAGTLAGAGVVSIDFVYGEDIAFTLASANTNVVRVPASVVLSAGQTNATFDLFVQDDALLDGTSGANITTGALGFSSSSMVIRVHDNETATLGWALPATLVEGVQNVPVTLTVSSPPDANVLVALSSTASTRLQMPTSVTLSVGQTSRVFNVNVINDKLLQGSQTIELRAHVENWTDGVAAATLLDNESTNFTWRAFLEGGLVEGMGTIASDNAFSLQLDGSVSTNVIIALASSDTSELTVPVSIVIPAGQTVIAIPITIIDDLEFDGGQPVSITAKAPGFGPAGRTLMVQDNDVHHLAITGIPRPPTAGFPRSGSSFTAFVNSQDVNGTNIFLPFNSPLTIALLGPNGPLTLAPTNILSGQRGSWSAALTPIGWGSNVVLVATTTNGVTGQSAPFDITPPLWAAALRITGADIAGSDVRLHLATQPGYTYQVERADEMPAPVWMPVGPPVIASSNLLVITDHGGANRPSRFYRLSLLP